MAMNSGVSFGFLSGLPAFVIGIFLLGLMVYAVKMRELWGRVGVGMMIVGGLGNLGERMIYGAVVDNWNFFGLFYNNVWDYLIAVGVGIYMIQLFRRKL